MNLKNERQVDPLRALLHPLWVIGLFVLVINDHVLKASDHAGWMTGKLSDFAGLLIVPVLLAALLGAKTRRGLWISGGLVGIVFAAINLSAPVAVLWDRAASMVYPYQTTVDPTDLVALISIPLGIWMFTPWMERRASQSTTLRIAQVAMVILGGLSSIATSPPPCENDECICEGCEPWPATSPVFQAQVSVFNRTNELHVLRIRHLQDGLSLDCEQIATNPTAHLGTEVFGPAERWLVQSGQEIGIQNPSNNLDPNRGCNAALIQSDSAPNIMAFWDSSLEVRTVLFDVDGPRDVEIEDQTIVLEADYSDVAEDEMKAWRFRTECGMRADWCDEAVLAPAAEIPAGARYMWSTQGEERLHFELNAPDHGDVPPSAECATPGEGDGLIWGEAPWGVSFELVELESGEDGCHQLSMTSGLGESHHEWWFCGPREIAELLAPAEGTVSFLLEPFEEFSAGFRGGNQGIQILVEHQLEEAVTSNVIHLVRGYSLPKSTAVDYSVEIRSACEPVQGSCGEIALPVDLEIRGELLRPGASLDVGTGTFRKTVHLARAIYEPVVNASCSERTTELPPMQVSENAYIEAVIVTQ